MSRQLRVEYQGAFYHVTARGNERKNIFKSRRDYLKFLSCLKSANEKYLAGIHAYCLMTNHYHLLVQTPLGNLSQIMHHINASYTIYFNLKWKRSGHLLQGRYKAIVVDADSYACELSRYIHLNPVRAGIVSDPEGYEWTSYHGYTNTAMKPNWLTTKMILGYFCDPAKGEKYASFVREMVGKEYKSPLAEIGTSVVLGNEEFVEEIYEERLESSNDDGNLPALRYHKRVLPLGLVAAVVDEVFCSMGKRESRKAAIYICHMYSGTTLAEIGAYFGLSASGVTHASKRLADQIKSDKEFEAQMEVVRMRLSLSNL